MLRDIAFQPPDVTVQAGETVTWEHRDGNVPHTVTSSDDSESFDSHPTCTPPGNPVTCMTEGDTFSHTFETAGTFAYRCKIHSSMTGTVTVEPADEQTTTTSSTTTTTAPPTTTTSPPETTLPPATDVDAGSATTTTDATVGDEAAADRDDGDGGGSAAGLAVILLTLIGAGAFLVWRFRPKPAIVVDVDGQTVADGGGGEEPNR